MTARLCVGLPGLQYQDKVPTNTPCNIYHEKAEGSSTMFASLNPYLGVKRCSSINVTYISQWALRDSSSLAPIKVYFSPRVRADG